jgi:lactate dehydrogenase-like 2-hydroxyacid dehydrogenase
MITQSKKINKSQFEAIKKLFNGIEIDYKGIKMKTKLISIPIFGKVGDEEIKIGNEVVFAIVHYHFDENSLYLEMRHYSFFY